MSRTPRSRGFPRMTAAFRSGLINARTGRAGSQRISKGGSTSMANVTTRRVVAAVVALIGGYLLYVSADPASGFGTTLLAFWAGVALFVAVGAVLIRYYQPGVDAPSADEVDVREWRFVRFLRYGREAAPLYLGLRLFLAYEWIQAGLHKLGDPGWMQTGQALQGYWQRAVTVDRKSVV